jgi:hypothetical protein
MYRPIAYMPTTGRGSEVPVPRIHIRIGFDVAYKNPEWGAVLRGTVGEELEFAFDGLRHASLSIHRYLLFIFRR